MEHAADCGSHRAETSGLIRTDARGVYLKEGHFAGLIDGLHARFAEVLSIPPDVRLAGSGVIPWSDLERCAYVERFPQLVSAVVPYLKDSVAAPDRLALTPAACLVTYRHVAQGGPLGPEGLTVAVGSPCHRIEAEYSEARLRAFTMDEFVFFGTEAQVRARAGAALDAAVGWLDRLGLAPERREASDPFWGRGGEIMAGLQRAQQSKVELILPIGEHGEVACLSLNLHGEFFSQRWDIRLAQGGLAHSACLGVGLERLALALVAHHGRQTELWPNSIRDAAGLVSAG